MAAATYTGGVSEGTVLVFATTGKKVKRNEKGIEIARVTVLKVAGDDARTRERWTEFLSCLSYGIPSTAQ